MTSGTRDTGTAGVPTPRPGLTSLPAQQPVTSMSRARLRALPAPVVWGAVWGVIQAASPLGFWWLAPKTVYALGLALIAAVYIGFSVADGRWKVIAAESGVAGLFVVIAAVSVSGSVWLLVLGLAGHGLKDLWQHRTVHDDAAYLAGRIAAHQRATSAAMAGAAPQPPARTEPYGEQRMSIPEPPRPVVGDSVGPADAGLSRAGSPRPSSCS